MISTRVASSTHLAKLLQANEKKDSGSSLVSGMVSLKNSPTVAMATHSNAGAEKAQSSDTAVSPERPSFGSEVKWNAMGRFVDSKNNKVGQGFVQDMIKFYQSRT